MVDNHVCHGVVMESLCVEAMKWTVYKSRVGQYYIVNEITTEEKKRAQFTTMVGKFFRSGIA